MKNDLILTSQSQPDQLNPREVLDRIKALSDDPDTKVSCFALTGDDHLLVGANRFPWGVEKTPERLSRPLKYTFIQHAEINLICSAGRFGHILEGSEVYLDWYPCAPCAGALVSARIGVLYCNRTAYESRKDDPRYQFAEAAAILSEGGVSVRWLEDLPCSVCGRLTGGCCTVQI